MRTKVEKPVIDVVGADDNFAAIDAPHKVINAPRPKKKVEAVVPKEEPKRRVLDTSLCHDEDLDPELSIRHNFTDSIQRKLLSRKVPYTAFMRRGSEFNLGNCTSVINAELRNGKVKSITAKKQLKEFAKFKGNLLRGHYLYVISSYPSDLRAKQLALYLFNKAREEYEVKRRVSQLKRTPPLWHNLMGGFRDDLLDDRENIKGDPALLVISNVVSSSTGQKFEKLRDLLTKYEHIPKIIVTSDENPVSFMLDHIQYSMDGSIYIASESA